MGKYLKARKRLYKQMELLAEASERSIPNDGIAEYSAEMTAIAKELNSPISTILFGLLALDFTIHFFVFIKKLLRGKSWNVFLMKIQHGEFMNYISVWHSKFLLSFILGIGRCLYIQYRREEDGLQGKSGDRKRKRGEKDVRITNDSDYVGNRYHRGFCYEKNRTRWQDVSCMGSVCGISFYGFCNISRMVLESTSSFGIAADFSEWRRTLLISIISDIRFWGNKLKRGHNILNILA